MFKIELRSKKNNILVKKKLYESEKQFNKWYEKHSHRYACYHVIGYKFDGEWKKV